MAYDFNDFALGYTQVKTILHIIDTTGPGGAETVFIDLATHLPKGRFRSVVVIRGEGWVYDELVRRGVKPTLLDCKGSFNWRYLLKLSQLIKREKVDLIQSHLLGSNVYASLTGLICRIPVVSTFHGTVDLGVNERFKSLKIGAINLGANHVIAVSKDLQNDILNRTKLSKKKTQVIYNGIKTSNFYRPRSHSLRQRFGWGQDDFVIGCLGNIRPAKGYEILFKAALLLEDDGKRYRFVIAGQADKAGLYESLLSLRQSLGLEQKVQFLGFQEDAAEFLSNLDLFLSTSITEGLPLSAIQAMAAKVPLLATRCGGYKELVADRENGWLVDIDDPKAVADAIQMLASSPQVLATIARKGQKHVQETFDQRIMLKCYQAVYEGLV